MNFQVYWDLGLADPGRRCGDQVLLEHDRWTLRISGQLDFRKNSLLMRGDESSPPVAWRNRLLQVLPSLGIQLDLRYAEDHMGRNIWGLACPTYPLMVCNIECHRLYCFDFVVRHVTWEPEIVCMDF